MWLELNPSRKDPEIAYRNDIRMLQAHGVPFREVEVPIGELKRKHHVKKEIGLPFDWKKVAAECEGIKANSGITDEWHELFCLRAPDGEWWKYLYIPTTVRTGYLVDLRHFAYCGCWGCQDCLDHPDRWDGQPYPTKAARVADL